MSRDSGCLNCFGLGRRKKPTEAPAPPNQQQQQEGSPPVLNEEYELRTRSHVPSLNVSPRTSIGRGTTQQKRPVTAPAPTHPPVPTRTPPPVPAPTRTPPPPPRPLPPLPQTIPNFSRPGPLYPFGKGPRLPRGPGIPYTD